MADDVCIGKSGKKLVSWAVLNVSMRPEEGLREAADRYTVRRFLMGEWIGPNELLPKCRR